MPRDNSNEQEMHLLVRSVGLNAAIHPLVSFGVSVIIARAMGPEGRGGYGVLIAMITALPMFAGFGLAFATRYFCAHGSVNRASLLKTVSMLGLFLGTIMAGCVLLAWRFHYPKTLWPGDLGTPGITFLALILFLSAIIRFWGFYLTGQERYAYNTWAITAGITLQTGALLAAWLLATVSLDIAVATLLLPVALRFLLFPILARDDLHAAVRAPWLTLSELRGMLGYGRWIYLSSILGLMAVQLIIFLLSTLSGLYETGLYTAVVGPANLLLLFGTPLVTVLSSRATRRMGDANFAGQVAASLRLIFYVTVALAVLSLLVAPLLIPWIFGAGFTGAVLPFRILLPGIVAVALKAVMDEYLVGSGQPHRVIMISATTAILTLTLGLLLLPDHGATGAATAVTSARLGSTLVAVHAFLRVSGLRLKQLCKPRRSDWYPLGLVLGFLGLHRSRAP